MQDFGKYKQSTVDRFRSILVANPAGTYDEAALPAYTNPNPLMRWLFWQRIKIVLQYLETIDALGSVMDFGCGLGVMLPYLNQRATEVIAVDKEVGPVQQLAREMQWSKTMFQSNLSLLSAKYHNGLNIILALDVLEHVDDLEHTLESFSHLLRKDGRLIVSGPTENLFYRTGRKLAGYSGDYHCRNVYAIERSASLRFVTSRVAVLVPAMPLFIIFQGRPA